MKLAGRRDCEDTVEGVGKQDWGKSVGRVGGCEEGERRLPLQAHVAPDFVSWWKSCLWESLNGHRQEQGGQ